MYIKLKQPLNYRGAFYAAGTVLPVDAEFGKKLVDSGAAEYIPTAAEQQAQEAQRIADEKTDEVQKLEQELRQAQGDIKALQDTLEKERKESAGRIAELEAALAEAQAPGNPATGTKSPKKGDK